jgi:hypothetical protein
VSSFDQDASPSVPAAEEVPVPAFVETNPDGCSLPAINPNGCDLDDVDPNGCNLDDADPNGCTIRIVDDGEEEEDEIPLARKNSRRYIASGESSGVPSLALSALVGLQELSLANFDQALEDMVPEDLLSEPADGGAMGACADVLDAGLGSSRAASHTSSTLERGLEGQEAGLDCTAPMEVTEGPSALEVAAAENSALKDGAGAYTQPPRVLPGMIRLGWAARAKTQPPRVSELVLPLTLPWMFMWDLLLRTLIVWQQYGFRVKRSF